MKRLILAAVIIASLTACNKKPVEESAAASDIANTYLSELKTQESSNQPDWPLDAAKEQKAEAAAIAHDQYDPDSIYTGANNIAIPPPQLKKRLRPGESVEVKFRPVDSYPIFKVIASTANNTTRLRVVSEVEDVIDKVEMNHGECTIQRIEPNTVKFPKLMYYGAVFDLVLNHCTSEQIQQVDLYTTRGKLAYTPIVEE
ncbi:lipoprotein [Acinetobacter beijerinckii]|uniref:lipoprotein n=1 Tax=Acinetobacter beijerinckii TaxID=262668 RepID=UPI003AF92B9E